MPRKAKNTTDAAVGSSTGAPAKRQRTQNPQSRVKGRKGALKVVMDMPVDIILEICTHLDVPELLTLSNTSKNFRAVVTGDSSAKLFKEARERMGMPELLVPMPDLRYANLLFGKGCHLCGKKNAGSVDATFRARVCGTCYKKEFFDPEGPEGSRRIQGLNRHARYLATAVQRSHRLALHHIGDIQRVSDELDAKFPETSSAHRDELASRFRAYRNAGASRGPTADETQALEADAALDQDWFFSMSLASSSPWNRAPTAENDFQRWIAEQFAHKALLRADAREMEHFLRKLEARKAEDNDQIRYKRRKDIERRLEARGFEKTEFDDSFDFQRHPQVSSARPLTDRTYVSTVEPAVVKILEEHRRRVNESSVDRHYRDVRSTHPDGSYFPPAKIYRDLAVIAPVLDDVSRPPSAPFSIPDEVQSAANSEIARLIRTRQERLLRDLVTAYLDLVKEQKRDKKFDIKLDVLFEDDAFTPIDELPFTLPRLPPWIPRNKDDPILASDEQLTTFLDTSPLAQSFECSKCRQLFGAKKLFDHFYQYGKCVKRPLGGISFMGSGTFWEEASGADVETSPVRIDKEVLSVSLALHQAIEDTPLELDYESIDELPDLHMEFELPVSRWYAAGFACDCPNYEARFGLRGPPATASQIYQHWKVFHQSIPPVTRARIRTLVSYSEEYLKEYSSLQRIRMMNEHEEEYDSDIDAEMRYGEYGYGGYGGSSDDGLDYERFDGRDFDSDDEDRWGYEEGRNDRGNVCTIM